MLFYILIVVILASFLLAAKGAKVIREKGSSEYQDEYLLSSRELDRPSVSNLLLSSSFGINAVFYAAWLGFLIGAWALVIQAAWAASFFLLANRSERFTPYRSLHDFLGANFGGGTQRIAAVCSVVGILYFIGWEVNIGTSALSGFGEAAPAHIGSVPDHIVVAILVGGAVLFTLWGGLRGNSRVDKFLNLAKTVSVIGISIILIVQLVRVEPQWLSFVFPSFDTMIAKLGIWGLLTNIIFNLSWQFVDNSTWQSVIAGSARGTTRSAGHLKASGLFIFFTIGLFGTLIGIGVSYISTVTPDNILLSTGVALGEYSALLVGAMVLLIVACMISLIDGMLLAVALTVIVDLIPASFRAFLESRNWILHFCRLVVLLAGLLAVFGIDYIFSILGLSLFDFVYIVIVTQLALLGPVLVGLIVGKAGRAMYLSIVVGLVAGFGSVIYGVSTESSAFVDGAGTIAVIGSVVSALALVQISSPRDLETS